METPDIAKLISESKNITEIIEKNGYIKQVHNKIVDFIKENNIDTSHFTYNYNNNCICSYIKTNSNVNLELLREYIFEKNMINYCCCDCGLDKWLGKSIYLFMVHKNNNIHDNRLENLEYICPNCKGMSSNKKRK